MSGSSDSIRIDDLIVKLEKAKSGGFEEVELDMECYPYESVDYPVLYICRSRLENDEEYAIRQKQYEDACERERSLYESLKSKYGER